MNKRTSIALAAAGLTIAGLTTGGATYARTPKPTVSIVQNLSQKLGLPEETVMTALQKIKEEALDKHLKDLEKSGKLTPTQSDALKEKLLQLAKARPTKEALAAMTPEERRATMQKIRTDMKNWAKQQGINLNDVLGKYRSGI